MTEIFSLFLSKVDVTSAINGFFFFCELKFCLIYLLKRLSVVFISSGKTMVLQERFQVRKLVDVLVTEAIILINSHSQVCRIECKAVGPLLLVYKLSGK